MELCNKNTKLGLGFSLRLNSIKYRLFGSWNSDFFGGTNFGHFVKNDFEKEYFFANSLIFEKEFAKTLVQRPATCTEVFKIFLL